MLTVSRAQLYSEVWAQPVQAVAARYGISGVGLAKLLKRHRVPVPGRGYWQLLRARRKPRKPPLPPLGSGEADEITICGQSAPPDGVAASRRPPVERITVPEDLSSPHPLIAAAWRSLRNGKANDDGILQPRSRPRLAVHVTRPSLERALRVMDGLVKALQERGCPVSVGTADRPETSTVVEGERLVLRLEEYLRQIENPERVWADPNRAYLLPRYRLVPTGGLRLRIEGVEYMGVRRLWQDGKVKRLEDCLGSFVAGLHTAATALKGQRERRVQEERERQERHQRWLEQEKARQLEEVRVKELTRQLTNWKRAKTIREYVAAVRQAGAVYLPEEVQVATLTEWIAWAEQHADAIDPARRRPDEAD